MAIRAAIYVRVSDPRQEREGTSLETQEAACREQAANLGYQLVGVFREVYTGAVFDERPQLSRVRELIDRGEVDRVVVYHSDRFGRDPDDRVYLRVEARRRGVLYESVTDPLEDTDEGRLVDYIAGYAAKVERRQIRERAMRGRLARVHAGKLLPAKRPLYGCVWRDATKAAYDVDPTTGPILQRIFRQAEAGTPLRRMAADLQADGIPNPSGGQVWSVSTLHHILTNPLYTGEATALRWRSQRVNGKGYRHAPRPVSERVPLPAGTVPRLVEPATFAAVQERLRRNKEQAARNNRQPEDALLRAGYVWCGHCGRRLITKRTRYGTVYRGSGTVADAGCRCPEIKADRIDGAVWERVAAILTDPATVGREIAKLHDEDPTPTDLDRIDRGIAATERQQANHAKRLALIEDDDAAAPLVAELELLAARKRALAGDRAEALRQRAARERAKERMTHVDAWCRRVAANLGALDYAQRRTALEALSVRVDLFRQGESPRWRLTAAIPTEPPCPIVSGTTSRSPGGAPSGPHRASAPSST